MNAIFYNILLKEKKRIKYYFFRVVEGNPARFGISTDELENRKGFIRESRLSLADMKAELEAPDVNERLLSMESAPSVKIKYGEIYFDGLFSLINEFLGWYVCKTQMATQTILQCIWGELIFKFFFGVQNLDCWNRLLPVIRFHPKKSFFHIHKDFRLIARLAFVKIAPQKVINEKNHLQSSALF